MAFVTCIGAPGLEWWGDFQFHPQSLPQRPLKQEIFDTISSSDLNLDLTICDLSDKIFDVMPFPNIEDSSESLSTTNDGPSPQEWRSVYYPTPDPTYLPVVPSPQTVTDVEIPNSFPESTTGHEDLKVTSNHIRPNYQRQPKKGISSKRRKRTRDQNRESASRSRQKKKRHIQELQETVEFLESQKSTLLKEFNELREEVIRVKNLLVIHSECNNPEIDDWIKFEAGKFVKCI